MIYHISLFLTPYYSPCNVIHYVSFRAIASLLTTLISAWIFGPWFLATSERYFRSKVRELVPERHQQKNNLPTMGGLFILFLILSNTFFWCNLSDMHVWIILACFTLFGCIGGWDDWKKIHGGKGLSARSKWILQIIVASAIVVWWLMTTPVELAVVMPFFKNLHIHIGLLFFVYAIFILVGASNGVNLTDGLDGLAIGSLIPNFATFAIIAYLSGNTLIASYLSIPYMATAEVAIIASICIGGSLGFLWYNTYPAQIFMGDVGSLSLGAGLALIALMTKQELLLALSGGIFVLEVISVIIQVVSFKRYKKRIFRMAPIHHHFELSGCPESKITIRCSIISFVLCLLALITLKTR